MSSAASERTRLITTEPIGKTMVRLTIPMIFGIVALMLVGVVDAWFVSMLGTDQLAALGFSLPVTLAVVSTALGMGMGISSLISRLLGEGQFDQAARLVSDARLLTLLVSLVILLVLVLFQNPLYRLLGADDDVMPYINDFMRVWLFSVPFILLMQTGNTTIRATGDPRSSAMISSVLAITNGVLDPLFIFGWGPVPAMGISGAALATVLAFVLTYLMVFYRLAFREKLIIFAWPSCEHLFRNWRALSRISVPAIFANIMTPLAAAILTAMIARFGTEAVAGFGVATRIESLALIVIFALSATLPMFIGQNLGAKKPERAHRALFISLKFGLLFQGGLFLVLALSAPYLASVFGDSEGVQIIICYYLWIVPLTYGAHGIVILVMVSLNVLNRPKTALLTTILRLMVINIPLSYAGGVLGGEVGLFFGFALGNIVAGFIAYRIILRVWAKEVGVPEQV